MTEKSWANNDKCKELLDSISSQMRLTKSFFKSIYAKELTWRDGFADVAIERLEQAGCSRAREYYESYVLGYQAEQDVALKEVASWYRRQCEQEWERKIHKYGNKRKGGETERIQREMELLEQKKMLLKKKLVG